MGIRFNARTSAIETDAASIDFTQPITTPASTTSLAGLNIAEGVAPSAPVDGDVWVTAAGEFNARLNGATVDLSASAATNLTWTASTRVLASSTGTDATITLFTATEAGLTPLSGGGTTNFLRADGTWAAPAGGGTIGGSITDNQIAVGATTADDIEGQSNLTYVSGTILTQINTGGTARDVRHFSDSTDAVDLVLRYDGSNFEYRSETGGAGNLYMQFTQADGGVDFGGDVTATGAVTGSNLSGTNTGDQTITLTGDVTGTGTGSFATTIAAKAVDVAMLADGTDGELITWSATGVATTVATGTSGHVLTSNGAGAAPTFQAAAGGGNVSNTGTPVNNQLAIWTDATTIEGDAKVTFDGSSFAAYGDGTATDLHYLGLDSTNRFRFECGTNYGMILYEDDNVSTEDQFFYIGNSSLATGNQNILFRDGGSDWYHAEYYGTTARYRHTGPIEILGTTDHVGTGGLGTGIDSNYIQLWGKSGTLDHEPMITCGDLDIDHTVANIIETCYHFDQTTTAADPGAGNLRWNNATPGSVTNWYVDDLESTGKDASFVLSNLANGDVITLRSQWDDADYMVASVNGTPTDFTGYWQIPVTVIHAGGRPATGDPVHLLVDWVNPLQNNVYARKSTGTQTVSSTTFTTATNYSGISLDAGVYLCSGQFRVNRNNTSNNVQIRWTSSTYRTSSPSTDMDSSRTRVFFTYSDSSGTTQFVQMVGDTTSAAGLNLSTNTSTSWVQVEGVFTVNSATTLDWEIRTSNVATSIRMEDGGVIKFTKISGSTTTTSGTYLS